MPEAKDASFLTLASSCVLDPTRLDPTLQRGRVDPKLKRKGDYAGCKLQEVPCKHAGVRHVGAHQIFPIMTHPEFRSPTVKHACCCTYVASSLRACSNKVSFDPTVFTHYRQWFLGTVLPEWDLWLRCGVTVDMENWLKRYPMNYRNKMRKAYDVENRTYEGEKLKYEAFAKIELQFTTTLHILRDTPLNDVKERQICGPSDEKKVMANALINELERVAHENDPHYCGRQNWEEICESINKCKQEHPEWIWFAADGSGFDMSQLKQHNILMNELINKAANHDDVVFHEPLTPLEVARALDESKILNVTMDQGALAYQAEGRASGDGWTTFGNTVLMASYWRYTFHLAGITHFFLKVKGDDVLGAFDPKRMDDFNRARSVVFTTGKHDHAHGLAQICKKVDFGDIIDLDFLSNDFFYTADGNVRMTRKPARVFQTNSWTTKIPQNLTPAQKNKLREQLVYSKGKCLQAWAADLPIWGVLAEKMIALGQRGPATEYNEYADGARVWTRTHQGDYAAYCNYLHDKFGITHRDVSEIEEKIRNIKSLSGEVEIPQIDRFYV